METEKRSKRLKQPCSPNCENRSAICHSICEKWLVYEKDRNKAYEERMERKEAAIKTYPAATQLDRRFRK